MVLILAACGNKKSDVAVNTEATETVAETTTEVITTKEPETEEPETTTEAESVTEESETDAPKQENSDNNADKATEVSNNHDNDSQQTKDTQSAKDTQPASEPQQTATPEPVQPEPTPEQPQRIEYSPHNVVNLATAKVQAGGKITLTDDLDNLLANGAITQEEYNEYYPYDGAGYYSVFVDSNLAEARDVSGTEHFNSEDDIAQYIADMLLLENGDSFLIEYAGTYDYYGKICYEFRCYRA